MAKELEGIRVEIVHAGTEGRAKCLRCRKWEHECGFDQKNGCENLLCNRCAAEVKKYFPDDPAYINFVEERVKAYGAKEAADD